MKITSDYLTRVFDPVALRARVTETCEALQLLKDERGFEAIAFSGVSGAALAFPLSLALGVPLIVSRKTDGSHSTRGVEGALHATSYVIVDDFVASGRTLEKIACDVKEGALGLCTKPLLVAVVFWGNEHRGPARPTETVRALAKLGRLGELACEPGDLPVLCLGRT